MAQLDNAADSDSEERGFESLQADQKSKQYPERVLFTFLCLWDSNPERASGVNKTINNCF